MGPFGSFLELFFSCLYLQWSSKVVLEASGLDFGSILEGLGRILGGFGEGFGGGLGVVWRVLVSLQPLFGVFFWCLYSECSPKGVLEAPGLDFGSIFKGLGEVWGGFGEGLENPKLEFSRTTFFDFVFWLLVLLEGFGTKTRCLKIA